MFDTTEGPTGAPAAQPTGAVRPPLRGAAAAALAGLDLLAAAAPDELAALTTTELLGLLAQLESLGTLAPLAQARVTAALDVAEPAVRTTADPETGLYATAPHLSAGAVSPQEVSTVLGCAVETVRDRVATAAALVGLPAVTAAARVGALRWWQLRRVADAVAGLDAFARAEVDRRVAADAAAGRCRSRFAARLRRAVLAADPARAEAAHGDARAGRRVTVRPGADGMAWFGALLPAEDALTVGACLDALADPTGPTAPTGPADPVRPGEPQTPALTADQARADALVRLCREALDRLHAGAAGPADTPDAGAGGRPRGAGRRGTVRRSGEVQLVVSAETLLGIGDAPGDLRGYGPVDAAHARRIAHRSGTTWRRIVTDPASGAVLDRGRTTYTPPRELAAHVEARGGWQCSRPGCGHRAVDLDHATPWRDGGATAADNLHGVCRGCHTAKETGWRVEVDADGGVTWTAPHGTRVRTPPADLRPEDRFDAPPRSVAHGVRAVPTLVPDGMRTALPGTAADGRVAAGPPGTGLPGLMSARLSPRTAATVAALATRVTGGRGPAPGQLAPDRWHVDLADLAGLATGTAPPGPALTTPAGPAVTASPGPALTGPCAVAATEATGPTGRGGPTGGDGTRDLAPPDPARPDPPPF